jgi:hypothetical protein
MGSSITKGFSGEVARGPPPLNFGRSTAVRPMTTPNDKRRAAHYGKWYLPTPQLCTEEYHVQRALYLEKVGSAGHCTPRHVIQRTLSYDV